MVQKVTVAYGFTPTVKKGKEKKKSRRAREATKAGGCSVIE